MTSTINATTINTTTLRAGLRAAVVVAVAGLLAAPAAQAQQKQQQQRGPLVLEVRATSMSAARSIPNAKGSPIVGHMYVEYMIPRGCARPIRS